VGEDGENLTTRPSWLKRKNDVSSTLLKKGKERKKFGSLAQRTINDGSFAEGKSVVISYLIL
jgi:hypothetical protein